MIFTLKVELGRNDDVLTEEEEGDYRSCYASAGLEVRRLTNMFSSQQKAPTLALVENADV